LNWDIVVAILTVNELALSPAGIRLAPLAVLDEDAEAAGDEAGADDEADVEDDEDDEQPAATTAAAAARAIQPNRGRGRPPRPLLSSPIPYPFRPNAFGYADAGNRTTRVSLRDER
jgi:hypothetical protein